MPHDVEHTHALNGIATIDIEHEIHSMNNHRDKRRMHSSLFVAIALPIGAGVEIASAFGVRDVTVVTPGDHLTQTSHVGGGVDWTILQCALVVRVYRVIDTNVLKQCV
jgi:hypothetical protein